MLNRWKECFDELLNVECEASVDENFINTGTDMEGFSADEIAAAVHKLKWGKAAGLDEIRTEYLKCSGAIGVQWLHRIFNTAWRSGVVPSDWTGAVISPIHKKGNTMDCNNYRGISLLSVVGKVYSSLLEKRVRVIVEPLLDENQSGFRPMRGCQDQIFCLRQLIEKFHECNKDMYVCFVDLKKGSSGRVWSEWATFECHNQYVCK